MRKIKYLLGGLFILLIVGCVVQAIQKDVTFTWNNYLETGGSPDVNYLTIYQIDNYDVILERISTINDISLVQYDCVLSIIENKVYRFVMTATDSAGNESGFSNVALLDLEKPNAPLNLNVIFKE